MCLVLDKVCVCSAVTRCMQVFTMPLIKQCPSSLEWSSSVLSTQYQVHQVSVRWIESTSRGSSGAGCNGQWSAELDTVLHCCTHAL